MRFGMMLIVLVGHAAVALFANAAEPDSVSDDRVVVSVSEEVIVPFLKQHCVRCHKRQKQNGQVRFDEVEWGITNNDSAQRWQDVLDILNAGDMPP